MVVSSLKRITTVITMLFFLTPVLGQAPPSESPVNLKMRQIDARLNAPVTFHADRMYLGELMEALSLQTQVVLTIDDADSFSGVRITCDLKQIPLADVMNALWSLVGFKNGLWEWKSDSKQSPAHYYFHPTQNARNLAERLNREMQEAFEAQAELMIRMASLSPVERQASADKLAASMLLDDTAVAKNYVDPKAGLDQFWAAIRLFANIVPPEARTQIFRGETVYLPLSSLSADDRQLALKLGGRTKVVVTDGVRQEIAPDTIRFRSTRYIGNHKDISMHMFISVGGKEGFQGMSYFGMLTFGLLPRAYASWILPHDLRILDIDRHPLNTLVSFKQEDIWAATPILDHDVAQLAATEGVSFLAVIPEDVGFQMPRAFGKTPEQYFAELWKDEPYLMHKWRDGIMLLSYPTWFYGDDAQYAYGTVKRLRKSLKQQDGLLSLKDVAEPATTLKQAQLKRLSEEFPAFQNAPLMAPVCDFYRHYPKSQSDNGITVDLKIQAFLTDSKLWPTALEDNERVTAVRILDVQKILPTDGRHTYHLQLLTSKHTWRDIAGFWIVRIPPK